MKKLFIFAWLLTLPHTVWLADALEFPEGLCAIPEEDEDSEKESRLFSPTSSSSSLPSPTSPPPVGPKSRVDRNHKYPALLIKGCRKKYNYNSNNCTVTGFSIFEDSVIRVDYRSEKDNLTFSMFFKNGDVFRIVSDV